MDNLGRRRYAAMVKYMDDVVGDIVAALKTEGMYDNTIIVFSRYVPVVSGTMSAALLHHHRFSEVSYLVKLGKETIVLLLAIIFRWCHYLVTA